MHVAAAEPGRTPVRPASLIERPIDCTKTRKERYDTMTYVYEPEVLSFLPTFFPSARTKVKLLFSFKLSLGVSINGPIALPIGCPDTKMHPIGSVRSKTFGAVSGMPDTHTT